MSYSSKMTPSQKMGCFVLACMLFFVSWYWYHDGVFSKMWVVTYQKPGFWVVIALFSLGYPAWRRFRNPQGFTLQEAILQAFIMPIAGILVLPLFFYLGTDLRDREVLNAYAKEVRYHEEWTEWQDQGETCDSKGQNCRRNPPTCSNHHPAYWELLHSIDSHGVPRTAIITKQQYGNYKNYFRNERKENEVHPGQCSIFDGNVFISTFRGPRDERIPTAISHEFVNYVKGSQQTLRRHTGQTQPFRAYLKPYPTIKTSQYGPIEIDRVIAAKVSLPSGWAETVDRALDMALTDLGAKRQVNLLVYVVGTNDQAFVYALKEYWAGGKKNDVIVVIGSANGHDIDWVDASLAWTKNELFKVELRDRLYAMATLDGNAEAIAEAIADQVQQPGERGFDRQSMEEFEYLAGEVHVPFLAWLAILGTMYAFGWMIAWAFENNDMTDYGASRQERTVGDLFRMFGSLFHKTKRESDDDEEPSYDDEEES